MKKDMIREWMDEQRHSRRWLAKKCGVAPKTLNNWLGSERSVPQRATRIIESLMEADRIKQSEAKTQARLVLEFTPEEFEKICEAALREGLTVTRWAESRLRELAEMDADIAIIKIASNLTHKSGN